MLAVTLPQLFAPHKGYGPTWQRELIKYASALAIKTAEVG